MNEENKKSNLFIYVSRLYCVESSCASLRVSLLFAPTSRSVGKLSMQTPYEYVIDNFKLIFVTNRYYMASTVMKPPRPIPPPRGPFKCWRALQSSNVAPIIVIPHKCVVVGYFQSNTKQSNTLITIVLSLLTTFLRNVHRESSDRLEAWIVGVSGRTVSPMALYGKPWGLSAVRRE